MYYFPAAAVTRAFQVVLVVKNPPANAGDIRDMRLIPGLGRSPGEGNSNPFQYSCLGNLMNREAWKATVPEVAEESDTTEAKEHACNLLIPLFNNIYFSIYNQVILEFSPYSRHLVSFNKN